MNLNYIKANKFYKMKSNICSEIPLFSIVIANFNHGQFLEEAINSVLIQSCQDFELIIIDGGSKDKSVDIIKKYEHKLSWWVSERDNGQSDAFNKGFKNARGQFYFWLNADDILLPNSLEHAKNSINKYPNCNWFAANTIFFSVTGIVKKCSRGPKWRNFLLKNAPVYIYGPTSIFHKSIFELVGEFDINLNYSMDTELWLRFKNEGLSFIRIPRYFWGFRIHDNSKTSHTLVSSPNINYIKEQEYISKKHKFYIKKKMLIMQFLYKLLFGCYIFSLFDTLVYKGKNISNLK